MNKSEQTILASRNPVEYVDASIKSKLTPAQKARLAREWMKKTGYTRADILYARNRHPYWKKKKMENSDIRARRRLTEYNYSDGSVVDWTPVLVGEFLSLNSVGKDGRYLKRDRELAEHFKTTIPSIQYMRRKFRAIQRMLGDKASRAKFVEFLGRSESLLRKGTRAVEAYKTREAGAAKNETAKRADKSVVKKSAKKAAAKKPGSVKKAGKPKKPTGPAKKTR